MTLDSRSRHFMASCVVLLLAGNSVADDWPQWPGVKRKVWRYDDVNSADRVIKTAHGTHAVHALGQINWLATISVIEARETHNV